MFPIVPQNFETKNHSLLCPESIASFVTGSARLLVPGKVTAATCIAQGTVAAPVEPMQLLGQPDVVQVSTSINSFGAIDLDAKSKDIWCQDIHWVRALRLSDDCHSYNVQLKFQPSHRASTSLNKVLPTPKLILQAVRTIDVGQELLLWFSEDILAMLQIPFLTPANIQGQKKYVCTKCSALYESPNPLKLHIALSCGRQSISSMWEKISNMVCENALTNVLKRDTFDFRLYPSEPHQQVMRQRNAMDLSVPVSGERLLQQQQQQKSPTLYRPFTAEMSSSAFKPFQKKCAKSENGVGGGGGVIPVWPMVHFDHHQIYHGHQHVGGGDHRASPEDEAHIETLVSSLGKSKQGHICLYCGKCYSRKYGLKIHIRTHTGYKPLKCKFCMRPFGDPSNLNKHVRLHAEGNTPYKCDLCGKILVRRRDLDRHLKSRHMIEMHPDLNILQDSSVVESEEKTAS